MSGFNENSQCWEAAKGDNVDGEHLVHGLSYTIFKMQGQGWQKREEITVRASTRMALRTASSEMGCGKVCWGLVGLRRGALSGLLLAGSLDKKLSLVTIFKSWVSHQLVVFAFNSNSQVLDAHMPLSSVNITSTLSW